MVINPFALSIGRERRFTKDTVGFPAMGWSSKHQMGRSNGAARDVSTVL